MFEKRIRSISNRFNVYDLFRDFLEMAAISLNNALLRDPLLEQRYLEITKKYSKNELSAFPELLSITVQALESKVGDFLGEVFMRLELGNRKGGQIFTPYAVCEIAAELSVNVSEIDEDGFLVVHEPAVVQW